MTRFLAALRTGAPRSEPVHDRRVDGGPLGRHRVHGRRPRRTRPAWSRSRSSTRPSGDVALLMGGAAATEDLGRRRDVRQARRSRGPQPQGPGLDRPGAGRPQRVCRDTMPPRSRRSRPARSASCAPPARTPTSRSTTAARSPSAADAHQATSFQISGSSSPGRPPMSANRVDRPLEVVHRLLRPAGRVELVGEVVLDGGLEVQLAGPAARRRAPPRGSCDRGVPVARRRPRRGRARSGRRSPAPGSGSPGGEVRGSASARRAPRRGRLAPRATRPSSRSAAPIARGSSSRRADLEGPRAASEPASARSPERTRDHAPLDEDRPSRRASAVVGRASSGRGRASRWLAAVAVSPRRAWTRPRRSSIAGSPSSGVTAGGGLERGDGAGVVAERGAQLTDRRLEAGDVRVPQGERRCRGGRAPRGSR